MYAQPAEPSAPPASADASSEDDSAGGRGSDRGAGSLDELFGGASPVDGHDRAASTLAGLYASDAAAASAGGVMQHPDAQPMPQPGVASRPAASELSLDQVFRETPRSHEAARRSAAFSFDQFFSASNEQAPAPPDAGAPEATGDDTAARDIEQFHAWLEGLKKK